MDEVSLQSDSACSQIERGAGQRERDTVARGLQLQRPTPHQVTQVAAVTATAKTI